jgi:LysM repeat protein
MRAQGRVLAVLVVVAAAGCRQVGKDVEQKGFRLLGTERSAEWYPGSGGERGVDLGPPVNPETILLPVYDRPPERFDVRIVPEDTLDLYAKWTRRPVADLMRLNPEVRERGMVAGEVFHFFLTPGEFARFNGARNGYLATTRAQPDAGVLTHVRHEVREGETLRDILVRYATTVDLLERHNPGIRVAGIRPRQVLDVPIVGDDRRDQPAMPGPRPPSPPPAPTPPRDPKPVTATPAPAPKAPVAPPAPSPAAPAAAAAPTVYVVQAGDIMGVIAKDRLHVTRKALREANPGVDLDRLRPGQKLKVPGR